MKNNILSFYSYNFLTKIILLLCCVFFVSTSKASTLSTGQLAIGEFNTLSIYDPALNHDNVFSTAYFISIGVGLDDGAQLIFKFYEDSLLNQPFETTTLSINNSPIPFFYSFYHGKNKWEDLQGFITIEVISGTVDFDYFEVDAYSNGSRYKGNFDMIVSPQEGEPFNILMIVPSIVNRKQ